MEVPTSVLQRASLKWLQLRVVICEGRRKKDDISWESDWKKNKRHTSGGYYFFKGSFDALLLCRHLSTASFPPHIVSTRPKVLPKLVDDPVHLRYVNESKSVQLSILPSSCHLPGK